jgi:hypothetical protein
MNRDHPVTPNEFLWSLLGLAMLAWFFFDSLRARERALVLCRQACERAGMQFLDETVALARLGIRRGSHSLIWRRMYRFEYSDDGTRRGSGWVILRGMELEDLALDLETLGYQ